MRTDLEAKHLDAGRRVDLDSRRRGVLEDKVDVWVEIESWQTARPNCIAMLLCMNRMASTKIVSPKLLSCKTAVIGYRASLAHHKLSEKVLRKLRRKYSPCLSIRATTKGGSAFLPPVASAATKNGCCPCQRARGGLHHQTRSCDACSGYKRLAITIEELQPTSRADWAFYAHSCRLYASQARSQVFYQLRCDQSGQAFESVQP